MLERRVVIDAKTGEPVLETKTNSYTVVRNKMTDEQKAAFLADRKSALSSEAVEEKGAPAVAPPISDEPTKAPVEEEAAKPTTRKSSRKAKDTSDVGAPVE